MYHLHVYRKLHVAEHVCVLDCVLRIAPQRYELWVIVYYVFQLSYDELV